MNEFIERNLGAICLVVAGSVIATISFTEGYNGVAIIGLLAAGLGLELTR